MTIKKINAYAPYIISAVIIFTCQLTVWQALGLGVAVGLVSAIMDAMFSGKEG